MLIPEQKTMNLQRAGLLFILINVKGQGNILSSAFELMLLLIVVCKICIRWPGFFHPPNSWLGRIQISVHSPPWIKVHVSVSHITKHKVITYIPNLRLHRFVSLVTLLRTLGFLRAIMRLLNRVGALLNYTLSMWFSWEPTHWDAR